MEETRTPKPAFAADARAQEALSAAKAAWWRAGGMAARLLLSPKRQDPTKRSPPASSGRSRVHEAWLEAFRKDAADVAAGLYPRTEDAPTDPVGAVLRALDLLGDARQVQARRRRGGAAEVREEVPSDVYPAYYRQNFHFQSGGWFTPESARRYESQVEFLFAGTAGAMRRRALSLLARRWRDQDQRSLSIVDLACGSGAFLHDLKATFPRSRLVGVDLSHAYAAEARRRSGAPVVQAAAERLPFADASLDGVSCIYLFHELPPKVRLAVAVEIARVLKPGGVLAFADSLQHAEEPEFARSIEAFSVNFHEPYYASYQATDLPRLFGDAGLALEASDRAFVTKALLFKKPFETDETQADASSR